MEVKSNFAVSYTTYHPLYTEEGKQYDCLEQRHLVLGVTLIIPNLNGFILSCQDNDKSVQVLNYELFEKDAVQFSVSYSLNELSGMALETIAKSFDEVVDGRNPDKRE